MEAGGMKEEKKLQENVNHSANRCAETGERRENQWESYEQPPGKGEHKAERTRKRDSSRKRGERERKPEMRRQTTSGMMHPTMDYHRLLLQPGIIPQRIDLGKWRGGVVHWSIRIGWLSCRKNPVSNRVWWDWPVTRASITAWAKQQLPLSSLTSNSSLPHRLRQSGVALKQRSWSTNMSVWLRMWDTKIL